MDELTKAIEETKQKMAEAINQSGLPIGIVEMILADFMQQIQIMKLQPRENESESE
ncbi:MAG: hypothetical protein J6D29_04740 [Solobacterium sp.]|nr:hypothetical protein [Solobacterium sp.]